MSNVADFIVTASFVVAAVPVFALLFTQLQQRNITLSEAKRKQTERVVERSNVASGSIRYRAPEQRELDEVIEPEAKQQKTDVAGLSTILFDLVANVTAEGFERYEEYWREVRELGQFLALVEAQQAEPEQAQLDAGEERAGLVQDTKEYESPEQKALKDFDIIFSNDPDAFDSDAEAKWVRESAWFLERVLSRLADLTEPTKLDKYDEQAWSGLVERVMTSFSAELEVNEQKGARLIELVELNKMELLELTKQEWAKRYAELKRLAAEVEQLKRRIYERAAVRRTAEQRLEQTKHAFEQEEEEEEP